MRSPIRPLGSPWLLAAGLLIAVLLAGNLDLLLNRTGVQWDACNYFGPELSLLSDHIRAGRLLLWNPWSNGGTPDYAEPELGTVSPPALLIALLIPQPQAAITVYWLAIWIFGGLGMLLLARHLGSPPWGGVVASVAFVASGAYLGHAQHIPWIYSLSYLPWMVWRLDAAVLGRRWWFAVQAGALYGLCALGGYPAFVILTPFFLGLWVVGRAASEPGGGGWRKRLGAALALLLVAGGVGATVLSPSYYAIAVGTRGYSTLVGPRGREAAISSNVLPASALTTFSSPTLNLLNLGQNPPWARSDVSMIGVYVGAAATVFGLFGWRRRSLWRWWLVAMGLLFTSFALGDQLPVRGWAYDWLPPMRYFRNPGLARCYPMFLLIVLAALGTRDLERDWEQKRARLRLWLIATFLAVTAWVCYDVVYRIADVPVMNQPLRLVHVVVVWMAMVTIAWLAWARKIDLPRLARLVVVLVAVDALSTIALNRELLHAERMVPLWWVSNMGHTPNLELGAEGLDRRMVQPIILDDQRHLWNVPLKIPNLRNFVTLVNEYHERLARDPGLSRMALGPNRMWFSAAPAFGHPDNHAWDQFVEEYRKSGRPPLMIHSPEQMAALGLPVRGPIAGRVGPEIAQVEPASPAEVSQVRYEPNLLAFAYRAPSDGWLLVTDRWAPGWQATVNGRATTVYGGDFIFRAVPVSAGLNDIRFDFRPAGFFPLLFLSWGMLLAIGLVELLRRRTSPEPGHKEILD